nr:oligopeptide/dipeptide ABC transporter ATP-binding protein [Pullulanibacillus pueri]
MYAGQVIERGPVNQVMSSPTHPYTLGLIRSIPPLVGDVKNTKGISGSAVQLDLLPKGCPFYSRCDMRMTKCSEIPPPWVTLDNNVSVACHLAKNEGGDKNDRTQEHFKTI